MKLSKLDTHPDKAEIFKMLKAGESHKKISNKINLKYDKDNPLRISTAAISRYINKKVSNVIIMPEIIKEEIEKADKEKSIKEPKQKKLRPNQIEFQEKAEEVIEIFENFSMSKEVNNNLINLLQLLPEYIIQQRDAKEFKSLAEATKIYYELYGCMIKIEDPNASNDNITYDDIKAAELAFNNSNKL